MFKGLLMLAYAYARYSSDNQDINSIDAQIRAINDYAAKNNITVVKSYVDQAFSARTDNRPQFLEMISDLQSSKVDYVIVHKLDRFARNRYDSAMYKKKFKDHGVKLISVLERLDDSPESIILESMLEGMNEFYSANLSRETLKGLRERALKCKHTGGSAPFGYQVSENKDYIIDFHESIAVQQIFNMYLDGNSYEKIMDHLNKEGYRTKKNDVFGKNSLYSILSNEKYIGTYKFMDITIPDGMPAIIDKETWKEVQSKMIANKNKGARHRAKNTYLLTGLVKCSQCGHAMTGNTRYGGTNKKSVYSDYQCSGRKNKKICSAANINREYLENYVIEEIKKIYFSDNVLVEMIADKIIEHNKSSLLKGRTKYIECERSFSIVKRKIKSIIDAIADGIATQSMKEALFELEDQKIFLKQKLEELRIQNYPEFCFSRNFSFGRKQFAQSLRFHA